MKVDSVDTRAHVLDISSRALAAARQVSRLSPETKTAALLQLAALLRDRAGLVRSENRKDLRAGERNGLSEAMLDRLNLTSYVRIVREVNSYNWFLKKTQHHH